jgi:REP element-mobilizing transposase RayT
MPYDPKRHHRRSIRLDEYDYTRPGAYFVTLCTAGRERVLSRIVEQQVVLQDCGTIAAAVWRAIPDHFPHAALDEWVIMPDHMHGIIVIERRVTAGAPREQGEARGTVPGSLPAIIQNFKSVSTRRINTYFGTPGRRVWQEDYYERIVRDVANIDHIRRYIAANPARWRS